jgi:hypothetical protein
MIKTVTTRFSYQGQLFHRLSDLSAAGVDLERFGYVCDEQRHIESLKNPKTGRWSSQECQFLTENYPQKGLKWCAENLNRVDASIRSQASKLGLRLDKTSEFFLEFQARAAQSKVGRKRPGHSQFMKNHRLENEFVLTDSGRKSISDHAKKRIQEKGHPKGATGLVHTQEAKEKMSASSKKMWANMSESEKDKRSMVSSLNARKSLAKGVIGTASWKAAWREIGGTRKFYRSRWEANYARYLEWMKKQGQIKSWEHEPKTFWFEGIKRGCLSYLPDFRVIDFYGNETYHEVKGWMDDRSKTKIKRMAKYHPDVILIVIEAKQYKAIEKSATKFIQGWE